MFDNLIISGSIAIDRLMSFDGVFVDKIMKDKIDSISVSILMKSQETVSGGVGANLATNAASLGLDPILLGAVGEDAKDYVSDLSESGIDTSNLYVSKLPTATFTAFTDSENNQIGGFYPGAMTEASNASLKQWKDTESLVIVAANDPEAMRSNVAECSDLGLTLFYDPGQQTNNISGEDLLAGIEVAQIVMLNEYELSVLTQKTGKSHDELRKLVDTLIVTKGAKGLDISHGEEDTVHIDAVQTENVVDPTGAGDAFRIGYLYGQKQGWGQQESAKLGTVLASIIIQKQGPRHLVSKSEITTAYKQAFGKELQL